MESKIIARHFAASQHDPEITNMLDDALALASVGVAALKMLESLLPSAAYNVEEASKTLVARFMALAENAKAQTRLIDTLLARSPENAITAAIEAGAVTCAAGIADAVAGVVVAMQFQDRNTQVTDNAANVLQRYGSMLAEIRDRITVARAGGASIDAGVSYATKAIMDEICIGDIRRHFIEALAQVSLQCEQGHVLPATAYDSHDNVELF